MMSFARSVVAALFCLVPFVGKADVWAGFVDSCPATYTTQSSLKRAKGTNGTPLQLGKWIDDSAVHSPDNALGHQAWDFIADDTAGFKLRWSTYRKVGEEVVDGETFDLTVPVWYLAQGGYDGSGDWYGDLYEPNMIGGSITLVHSGRVWIRVNPAIPQVTIRVLNEDRIVDRVAVQWELNSEPGVLRRQCLLDSADYSEVLGQSSALKVVDGLWLYEARRDEPELKKTSLSFGHIVSYGDGISAPTTPHDFEFGAVWTFDTLGRAFWVTGGKHFDGAPSSSTAPLEQSLTYSLGYVNNGPLPTHCVPAPPSGGCPDLTVNTSTTAAGTLTREFEFATTNKWVGTATVDLSHPGDIDVPPEVDPPAPPISDVIHRYGYYDSNLDGTGTPGQGPTPQLIDNATANNDVYGSVPAHDETVGEVPGEAGVSGGAATYSIPIDVPPGRAGMQPTISLDYHSRSGNGHVGVGFSISGLSSISRCAPIAAVDGYNGIVNFTDEDALCLDGQRLLVAANNTHGADGSEYRTEIYSPRKVTLNGGGMGSQTSSFTVRLSNGRILTYGGTDDSRIMPPANGQTLVPMTWLLSSEQDTLQNRVDYVYDNFDSNQAEYAIKEIHYTLPHTSSGSSLENQIRKVTFEYETRPDTNKGFISGRETQLFKRLTSINTFFDPNLSVPNDETPVRRYELIYAESRTTGKSLLESVALCSYRDIDSGLISDTQYSCLPGTTFTWSDERPQRAFDLLGITDDGAFLLPDLADLQDDEPIYGCQWQQGLCNDAPVNGNGVAVNPPRVGITQTGDFDGDGRREFLVSYVQGQSANPVHHRWLLSVDGNGQKKGTLNLGTWASFNELIGERTDHVDLDFDGRTDIVGTNGTYLSFARWKDGASWDGASCDNPNSNICPFQVIPTTILYSESTGDPESFGDRKQFLANDFNADGLIDIALVDLVSGSPGQQRGIYIWLRDRQTPPVSRCDGTASNPCSFTALNGGNHVYALETAYVQYIGTIYQTIPMYETVDYVTDINGDGLMEIVTSFPDRYGRQGLRVNPDKLITIGLPDHTNTSVVTATPLNSLVDPVLESVYFRFADINGDGLKDLLYIPLAPNSIPMGGSLDDYRKWTIQLNRGGPIGPNLFASSITVGGNNGEEYAGVTPFWQPAGFINNPAVRSLWRPKFAMAMFIADYDGDGRDELMFPEGFATRGCTWTRRPDAGTAPVPPPIGYRGNGDPARYLCAPEIDTVDHLNPNLYDQEGMPAFDASIYKFAALEFEIDTLGGIEAQITDYAETQVVAGPHNGHVDDLFGDGLQDIVSTVGCRYNRGYCLTGDAIFGVLGPGPVPFEDYDRDLFTGWGDHTPGVGTPHLGVAISRAGAVNDANGNIQLTGDLPPDMLVTAASAMGKEAYWDYSPLSRDLLDERDSLVGSNPMPLYSIPSSTLRYIDEDHFYFTSSMYVVAEMRYSNGLWDDSTQRYNRNRYSYGEAVYNRNGRGFQGFRTVAVDTIGETEETEGIAHNMRTVTEFHQFHPFAGRVETECTHRLTDTVDLDPCTKDAANELTPVTVTEINWEQKGAESAGTIIYPELQTTKSYVLEPEFSDRGMYRQETVEWAPKNNNASNVRLDTYGNPFNIIKTTQDVGYATFEERTRYRYEPRKASIWWIDELRHIRYENSVSYDAAFSMPQPNPPSPPISTTKAYTVSHIFDDNTRQLLCRYTKSGSSGWINNCSAAVGTSNIETKENYSYRGQGNGAHGGLASVEIEAVQAASRTTTYGYSDEEYFVESTTQEDLTTTAVSRPRDGQPRRTFDPNNVVVEYRYDPFGREIERAFPYAEEDGEDVTALQTSEQYRPRVSTRLKWYDEPFAVRKTTVSDGAPTTYDFIGVLGRSLWQRQSMDTLLAGQRSIDTATAYYDSGRLQYELRPKFTGSAGNENYKLKFEDYDALGRPNIKKDRRFKPTSGGGKQGTCTRYDYNGLNTSIDVWEFTVDPQCDDVSVPNTISLARTIGAEGRVYQTTDAAGKTTRFWYDGSGNPVVIEDVEGNHLFATYDELGRRTRVEDPNAGISIFEYNGFGEVVVSQTANQVALNLETRNVYDGLGRMTQQHNNANVSGGGYAADGTSDFWVYDSCDPVDNPDGMCNGKLVSELRVEHVYGNVAHERRLLYDALGRPIETVVEIRGTDTNAGGYSVFTTRYAYDIYFDRIKGMQYPTGDVIYNKYHNDGFLYEQGMLFATGQTPWVKRIMDRDRRGNPVEIDYRNGDSESRVYHQASDQVRSIEITTGSGEVLQFNYDYDHFENLTEWERVRPGETTTSEVFEYDSRHRLEQTTRYGGASPKIVTYTYDDIGNLMSKSDFATSYNYTAAGLGANGPYQVREVERADNGLPSGVIREFGYDDSGNMITSKEGFKTIHSVTYDADHLPLKIINEFGEQSWFFYGPDHQRYRQYNSETDQETVYIDKIYERHLGPIDDSEKAYIGDYFVITRDFLGDATYNILHRDRLGSVVMITDRDGEVAERPDESPEETGYGPFGAVRDADGLGGPYNELESGVTPRGFTQHEHLDSMGLIHMNGRAYDPLLGRFLSVDPFIQFPTNSQSLNPYSYLMNNPMSGTDPTGFMEESNRDEALNEVLALQSGEVTTVKIKGRSVTIGATKDGNYVATVGSGFDTYRAIRGISNTRDNGANEDRSQAAENGNLAETGSPRSGAGDSVQGCAIPMSCAAGTTQSITATAGVVSATLGAVDGLTHYVDQAIAPRPAGGHSPLPGVLSASGGTGFPPGYLLPTPSGATAGAGILDIRNATKFLGPVAIGIDTGLAATDAIDRLNQRGGRYAAEGVVADVGVIIVSAVGGVPGIALGLTYFGAGGYDSVRDSAARTTGILVENERNNRSNRQRGYPKAKGNAY